MIGQVNLLRNIDKIITSYPKFSIIVGPKGSGKKLITKYICKKLNLHVIPFGTKIDEVREIIELSYEQKDPVCYVCYDADSMSLGAKNCLLKITEEPPNNAYFILTLQSMSNTLETIKSRGTVLSLDEYTEDELLSYRKYKDYSPKYDNIIKEFCTTTGEIDELFKSNIDDFYKFAETVAYQIHIPTTGNIFKISKTIKAKDTETGYDPILLFKFVRTLFLKKVIETKKPQYLYASMVTSECLRDLSIASLNKVGTVDNWIMSVRTVLGGI